MAGLFLFMCTKYPRLYAIITKTYKGGILVKKAVTTIVLLTAIISITRASEYNPVYINEWIEGDNLVSVGLSFPGINTIVRYERKLDGFSALGLCFSGNYLHTPASGVSDTGAGAEYNYYLQGRALNALYAGGSIMFYATSSKDRATFTFSPGCHIGYRVMFKGGFGFSPRLSLSWGIGEVHADNIAPAGGGPGIALGCEGSFAW